MIDHLVQGNIGYTSFISNIGMTAPLDVRLFLRTLAERSNVNLGLHWLPVVDVSSNNHNFGFTSYHKIMSSFKFCL